MTAFRSLGSAREADGTTGTTPEDVRWGLQGLFVRPGVLPGGTVPLVTGSVGAYEYNVGEAPLVTQRAASDGYHLWGNDAALTLTEGDGAESLVAPGAGTSRIDIIYALARSNGENGDTTSAPLIAVKVGTAAAVPVAPTIPSGALELARNTMTSAASDTGGTGNTISQTAPRTGVRGTAIPVPDDTAADELLAYASADFPVTVDVESTGLRKRSIDGATWEPLATQAYATAAAAAAQSAAEDHADDYHQDTGWRDVSADRGGNFSAGTLHLRRVGRHVELRAYGLTLTSTGGSRICYLLTTGFRASPSGVDVARPGVLSSGAGAHYRTAITSVSASGADVTVYDCPAATALFGALTWITDDDWPSTLPGTAV